MNDDPNLSPIVPERTLKPPTDWRRILRRWLPVAMLLAVFLAGLVPMWLKAQRLSGERAVSQRELRLSNIQMAAANATIDARRGEYEPARQAAAQFFTLLNEEVKQGVGSAVSAANRDQMKPILAQRDDLITLLARSDPVSADRLATIYTKFRQPTGR
jgi:hypothetical protein